MSSFEEEKGYLMDTDIKAIRGHYMFSGKIYAK
jgi:hypothetical protein